MPGTRQLSPLEVDPKKVQIHQYGQTKACYRGFRHSESKYGIYFVLTQVSGPFVIQTHGGLSRFSIKCLDLGLVAGEILQNHS